MKLTAACILFLLTVARIAASEPTDIKLSTGRTLTKARIVSIREENVSIVHASGAENFDASEVPLDVLARAHMELEATAADRKAKAEVAKKRAAEESERMREARDEEIRERLAMANVRESAQGGSEVAIPSVRMTAARMAQMDAAVKKLKTSTPKHPAAGSEDPAVKDCIAKYTRAFLQITATTIPQNTKWIRDNIASDLAAFQKTLATTDGIIRGRNATKSATGAMRRAAEANTRWLQSLLGHVQQFEKLVN